MKPLLLLPTLLFVALLPREAATAHPAWGIVVDRHGAVYISDLERVWKILPDGTTRVFVDDVHTHELYLDDAGALIGEHEWYDETTETFHTRYWRATPDGHVTSIPEDEAARFFDRWDADGTRYRLFNDRERAVITKRSPQKQEYLLAGGSFGYADGAGAEVRFRLMGASAWGPDGALYLTNGGLLRRVTRNGTVTTLLGPADGFPHSIQRDGRPRYSALLGLAVADDGTVYVADIDQRTLFRRSPEGAVEALLTPGPIWTPTGIALVDDYVYVVEYRLDHGGPTNRFGRSGPRVRRIAPDDRVTLVGIVDG